MNLHYFACMAHSCSVLRVYQSEFTTRPTFKQADTISPNFRLMSYNYNKWWIWLARTGSCPGHKSAYVIPDPSSRGSGAWDYCSLWLSNIDEKIMLHLIFLQVFPPGCHCEENFRCYPWTWHCRSHSVFVSWHQQQPQDGSRNWRFPPHWVWVQQVQVCMALLMS